MPPKNSKRYQKVDPITHILTRPDMYVGSTSMRETEEYVADKKSEYTIYKDTIKMSPAIIRIFIEVLSNAVDNVSRSKQTKTPCTRIKVNINKDTGETSIWNDGDIVPIEIDTDLNCYNHTMIFGQLHTGSNYDDEEERIVAGRNGLGSKLCNVCSTSFRVDGCDPVNKKILTQTWTNNMRDTDGPVVSKTKLTKGYTQITWTPDFNFFGLKSGYTRDIVKLYTRHVIDAAMISNVEVYLNDEIIPIKNLTQYSKLYSTPTEEKLLIKTANCEVLVTPSTEFQSISFVNGVYTKLGGQHVDSWSESVFRPIVDKFNGKDKKSKTKVPKINISDVKQFFRLFVVATVVRPEFDGQDKNKLESPPVESVVKKTQISNILKWSVMDNIEDIIRAKEMVVLKKSERTKKTPKIDGFDPANNAGGKKSSECTLIICEGLSAKTYAVAGIEQGVYGKSGRDWFGILPLTGKILNVRNAAPTSIASNKVVTSLIQALGAKHGVDYTTDENYKSLSYGRIMVMTDADCDGIHIEGLIMNFFHSLFPSLLKRESPYVVSMKTPIARVFNKRKDDLLFYDENRFNVWLSEQTTKVDAKYYKGLGTTKPEDVPDTFGLKMVEYVSDIKTAESMNKVFHKNHADDRKVWLSEYSPNTYGFSLDDQGEVTNMEISKFIDGEMIKFSHADCARSIPSGIDGLKESQRKILYSVMKRKLKYSGKSLKVAQLSGYTAEHSNYHHGEQNLQDTIIGMANEFPGTNNIPILYRDGQFGSRLDGGADAASARYIYTKMEMLTEYIYKDEDTPILTQINDDGDLVQPEFYIPIIPMILVNGCLGIGTGWSCNVPCYNPLDLIIAIKVWLDNDGEVIIEDPDNTDDLVSLLPEIKPWYRGFKGTIENDGENRFVTKGVVEKKKKNVTEVTELPIGMWTNRFKENCEDLVQTKKLKSLKNYSSPSDVNFVLNESENGMACNLKNLKLHTYLYTSNMVLFDENNQLKKYDGVDEVINNFCNVRYRYYTKRKQHQIDAMESDLKYLNNKRRFIKEVSDDDIKVMNQKESDIIQVLKSSGYSEITKDNDTDENGNGYDYLLRLHVRTFTKEKVDELTKDIKSVTSKIEKLKNTSEKQLWLDDLDAFEKQYNKFLSDMDKQSTKKTEKKKGKKNK